MGHRDFRGVKVQVPTYRNRVVIFFLLVSLESVVHSFQSSFVKMIQGNFIFQGVSRKIIGCFQYFYRDFKVILKKFERRDREVSMVLKGCSRKFQKSFKDVSNVFQESSQGIERMFQESFPWVSRVFERSSSKISEKFQRCFQDIQGSVRGVQRKLLMCFTEVSMVLD